ncbi:hypothetical protein BH23ACT3_BH23ACT3_06100 [soil metagenome]
MKLMIGFCAGFVAGAATYSVLTEQQRAGVADTLDSVLHRGRSGEVASSVSSGVGNVADAVTERVTEATTAATDAVAEKLESHDGAAEHDSTTKLE